MKSIYVLLALKSYDQFTFGLCQITKKLASAIKVYLSLKCSGIKVLSSKNEVTDVRPPQNSADSVSIKVLYCRQPFNRCSVSNSRAPAHFKHITHACTLPVQHFCSLIKPVNQCALYPCLFNLVCRYSKSEKQVAE